MMFRSAVLWIALVAIGACTNANDLDEAPVDLGDFRLGHNIVVAPNLTRGPTSRAASAEEWIVMLQDAIDARFGRYEGAALYHLGVSVEGYVLGRPGVPVIASPKSFLVLRVTAWDDAAGAKLNREPRQITVFESLSGDTILGSGLTQSKREQMTNLSRNAAKRIETWLRHQHRGRGWFAPGPRRDAAAQ